MFVIFLSLVCIGFDLNLILIDGLVIDLSGVWLLFLWVNIRYLFEFLFLLMNVLLYVLFLFYVLVFMFLVWYLFFWLFFNVLWWLKWLGLCNDGDIKLIRFDVLFFEELMVVNCLLCVVLNLKLFDGLDILVCIFFCWMLVFLLILWIVLVLVFWLVWFRVWIVVFGIVDCLMVCKFLVSVVILFLKLICMW